MSAFHGADVTDVDTHAVRQALAQRPLCIAPTEFALDLQRECHGVHGAGKAQHHAVAHGVEDFATKLGTGLAHAGEVRVHRRDGGNFVAAHSLRIAHHVGKDHRGKPRPPKRLGACEGRGPALSLIGVNMAHSANRPARHPARKRTQRTRTHNFIK